MQAWKINKEISCRRRMKWSMKRKWKVYQSRIRNLYSKSSRILIILRYKIKAYKKVRRAYKSKINPERNKLVIYVVPRDSKRKITNTLNPKWRRIPYKRKLNWENRWKCRLNKTNNPKKELTRRKRPNLKINPSNLPLPKVKNKKGIINLSVKVQINNHLRAKWIVSLKKAKIPRSIHQFSVLSSINMRISSWRPFINSISVSIRIIGVGFVGQDMPKVSSSVLGEIISSVAIITSNSRRENWS